MINAPMSQIRPPFAPPAQTAFRYRAFGIGITSQIELPLLTLDHTGDAPSVSIAASNIQCNNFEAKDCGVLWKTAPDQFQISVPGIGTMRVQNGCDIALDILPEAAPEQVETLILSTGFCALLQQRHLLAMHAAAVVTDAGAALLAGVSGAGKSLLLAALNQRGFQMISDDITALENIDGEYVARPSWNAVKLMPDASAKLGLDMELNHQGKHVFKMPDFCTRKMRVDQIIFLDWTPETVTTLDQISGVEVLAPLTRCVHKRAFLKGMQLFQPYFNALNGITRQARVYHLKKPHDLACLESGVDVLAAHLSAPLEAQK
ncbi:hypothetical protein [Planktotalea sp.]|uniref:hypothetical protein n=1 Tax=Planktotalea sp. TaxID=2029877 RepID=UPI003D6C6109